MAGQDVIRPVAAGSVAAGSVAAGTVPAVETMNQIKFMSEWSGS